MPPTPEFVLPKECTARMNSARLETEKKLGDLWKKNDSQDKQMAGPSWLMASLLAVLVGSLGFLAAQYIDLLKLLLHIRIDSVL